MGFSATYRVVYGDDARRAASWACDQLVDYITDKLNDAEGPYYEGLGLSESRLVEVSKVAAIAEAIYNGAEALPVVVLAVGPSTSRPSGRNIGSSHYKGTFWNLVFHLDSGVRDASPDDSDLTADNVADEAALDTLLADYVTDIFARRANTIALAALGLCDVRIIRDEEAQRAGEGRNPQIITCGVLALDDYAP